MIGIVLVIVAIPLGVGALAYGDYGAAGAVGAGLGALFITSLIAILPLALLARAKTREAQALAPIEWVDDEAQA